MLGLKKSDHQPRSQGMEGQSQGQDVGSQAHLASSRRLRQERPEKGQTRGQSVCPSAWPVNGLQDKCQVWMDGEVSTPRECPYPCQALSSGQAVGPVPRWGQWGTAGADHQVS